MASTQKRAQTTLDFFMRKGGISATVVVKELIDSLIAGAINYSIKARHGMASSKTIKQWLAKYPWLDVAVSDEEKIMTCTYCLNYGKINGFTKGSKNIQLSGLVRHSESVDHCDSVRLSIKRKFEGEDNSDILIDSLALEISDNDRILFNTVYFAAKEELPSDKINNLLTLQRLNGLEVSYQNLSWDTITDIQSCIVEILMNDLVKRVKNSPLFGISIDESTDLGNEKQLVICIRFIEKGKVTSSFLKNVLVYDGKATTIVNGVVDCLQQLGICMHHCVSLATDGAPTMTGRKMGVGVQLRAKYSPFIIQVHCLAHRLNLACLHVMKNIKELITLKSRFNSLHIHFSSSAIRAAQLDKIQKVLNDPVLKIKEPSSIRWLSLRNSVEAVYRCYPSVLSTLSQLGQDNTVAESLFKYFREAKVLLFTALMVDIHSEIGILSQELQKDNLVFTEVPPMIAATRASIELMKSKFGKNLQEAWTQLDSSSNSEDVSIKGVEILHFNARIKDDFKKTKDKYLDALSENIQSRLEEHDSEILTSLGNLLYPPTVTEGGDYEFELALSTVCKLYGKDQTTHIIPSDSDPDNPVAIESKHDQILDGTELQNEWPKLKAMLFGCYRNNNLKQLCHRVISLHSKLLPNFSKLCTIALCIGITSVECERSFSHQNRLKNKFRCSLLPEQLNTLLTILLVGPNVEDFRIAVAASLWNKKKKSRIGRLTAAYKKKKKD